MNAPHTPLLTPALCLHELALAALEIPGDASATTAEALWLAARRPLGGSGSALQAWLKSPPQPDLLLHTLAALLRLQPIEVVAAALAAAVETDALAGRVVGWLQAPGGGSRPSVGLVLALARALGLDASPGALLDGKARASGLVQLQSDLQATTQPLPEQSLHMPLPLCLTLHEGRAHWPGGTRAEPDAEDGATSLRQAAALQAQALANAGASVLLVRSNHPREARRAAVLVAAALGGPAVLFEHEPARGAGLWLTLHGAVAVLCLDLAPGETRQLQPLPGYDAPLLVACGLEGSVERAGTCVGSWRVPLPSAAERAALWARHTADAALAQRLGRRYRYDVSRIALLGHAAQQQARLEGAPALTQQHVSAAARSGVAGDLGSLAQLHQDDVAPHALILPPAPQQALHALQRRCELRETLAEPLGVCTRTRYRPGVRALFVGPSGTGKTLAALWLASALGLPLYSVDVAAISSKYIGDTEKNLAQLFSRAEHAELVLLFDEADALFGKRTDIKESHDRYANAQTNYLLQRIESFEGIAILTSNSRGRFDAAFTRRLDAIIDFPQPSPEERRALWLAHLGSGHGLTPGELNRLTGACDFAGGHIRNAVLSAAARARCGDRPIEYADVVAGVAAECAKLAAPLPAGLSDTAVAPARPRP